MTAEPYICIKGPAAGEIKWFESYTKDGCYHPRYENSNWHPYCSFEREKLKELDEKGCELEHVGLSGKMGYWLRFGYFYGDDTHSSDNLIGYCGCDYQRDTESNRLLKRAEFLKAVCEKEGVEWLAKEPDESDDDNEPIIEIDEGPKDYKELPFVSYHNNPTLHDVWQSEEDQESMNSKPYPEDCMDCLESLKNGHICGSIHKPSHYEIGFDVPKCDCKRLAFWGKHSDESCGCICHRKSSDAKPSQPEEEVIYTKPADYCCPRDQAQRVEEKHDEAAFRKDLLDWLDDYLRCHPLEGRLFDAFDSLREKYL